MLSLAIWTLNVDVKCSIVSAIDVVVPLMQEDGWAFDVELLLIANLKGLSVFEFAVPWVYQRTVQNSSVERWNANGTSRVENETTIEPKQF